VQVERATPFKPLSFVRPCRLLRPHFIAQNKLGGKGNTILNHYFKGAPHSKVLSGLAGYKRPYFITLNKLGGRGNTISNHCHVLQVNAPSLHYS
jgi:hypothetical protein